MYYVLCTVYCVLCTVYCVLCTVYCVLCTVYYVLCTVQVSVGAVAAAPVGKAKVYGPALEKAVKTFEPTYLIVDCKEAGPGC